MAMTNMTMPCMADVGVQYIMQGYLKSTKDAYATVAMITGAALPLVAGNILVSIWRLLTNVRNYRAYTLLIGSLGLGTTGAMIVQGIFLSRTRVSIITGFIGWVVGLVALNIAGMMRFMIPLTLAVHKKIYVIVTLIIVTIFGVVTTYMGVAEVLEWTFPVTTPQSFTQKFAAISLMLPVFYAFSGFICFSLQLRRAFLNLENKTTGFERMRSLEFANYFLMVFLLLTLTIYFIFFRTFKDDAKLDTPTALFFTQIFLSCENVFESLTTLVHNTTTGSMISRSRQSRHTGSALSGDHLRSAPSVRPSHARPQDQSLLVPA
ncbi:uncharacterized protein SPPG_06387 [Spizellomyces punctatus DAOM BR117]|uniref:G-protein coupled receptors family 1 profile domain-containing protein n=1 Tax=Spizellomyces punctatus (strain DAOM BR117) TaxID=645134 RepID=A0A0L0HCS3_SPIPD|nr:uncharacterized protein SPPG_06387 [Spizellomyces punctatus DAOM BR117]KNC98709.1 hypothetical protein SPPG_06387 [Spizellomyces punctatus DAOM BR117]|eukprot:XP_016606749.1 hypothetical protein SPPG_06387 [Spizellomyces punctatus DAOM BR117]